MLWYFRRLFDLDTQSLRLFFHILCFSNINKQRSSFACKTKIVCQNMEVRKFSFQESFMKTIITSIVFHYIIRTIVLPWHYWLYIPKIHQWDLISKKDSGNSVTDMWRYFFMLFKAQPNTTQPLIIKQKSS